VLLTSRTLTRPHSFPFGVLQQSDKGALSILDSLPAVSGAAFSSLSLSLS
jgi:hypothetical protein